MEKLGNQQKNRKNQIEFLKGCLSNPGKFSILLLGNRGVGKSHWINSISKSENGDNKVNEVYAPFLNSMDASAINQVFIDSTDKILLIKDIELLNKEKQDILFQILSTSNGQYGLTEKTIECRVVFTSTFKIETLRDSERYLNHRFIDRIAQLIVKLPSFQDGNRNIFNDFKATWGKMKFPENHFPNIIESWLVEKGHNFFGNFRDLDKIAINWNNLQNLGMDEDKILEKVQEDFNQFYHFPENQLENKNYFPIDDDSDYYEELLPNFRNHLKQRSLEIYGGDLKKAPNKKPFGVGYRTMERW